MSSLARELRDAHKARRERMSGFAKPSVVRLQVITGDAEIPLTNVAPSEINVEYIPTLEEIISVVASEFNVTRLDLLAQRKATHVREPRWVCWWLAAQTTLISYAGIGRKFGKDHTTIIHGIRRTGDRISEDVNFERKVEKLKTIVTQRVIPITFWGS